MAHALTPLVADEIDTPFGTLAVFADGDVVVLSGIGTRDEIARRHPHTVAGRDWHPGELPDVRAAVAGWVAGDPEALARVPWRQDGGEFVTRVWRELAKVPAGETVTYGELAEIAGSPRGARAVGTACATNAVAPFVPCHRVVAAGGKLGNYGYGGAPVKARMLALEGVLLAGGGE